MSTDAWLQEHLISEAILPNPRRTPKLPPLASLHAPTHPCLDAALHHAQNGDRAWYSGSRVNVGLLGPRSATDAGARELSGSSVIHFTLPTATD
jgi:hypothetical protein